MVEIFGSLKYLQTKLACSLTAVISLALISASGSTALPPAGAGYIYYSDETSGDIMRVNADGSGQTALAASSGWPGGDHFPSPSFDGRKVVFARYATVNGWREGGSGDLYMMDFDGSNLRRLTETPEDELTPSFASDGRIYFARSTGPGHWEVFRAALAEVGLGPATQLTDFPGRPGRTEDAVEAPNGRFIFFQTWDATFINSLDLADLDIFDFTSVSNAPCGGGDPGCPYEEDPSISPGSDRVAYASAKGGGLNIWSANPDGSGQVQLTTGGADTESWWSPDGTYIVFQRGIGEADIWVMRSDGSDEAPLVDTAGATSFPRWGRIPDGSGPGQPSDGQQGTQPPADIQATPTPGPASPTAPGARGCENRAALKRNVTRLRSRVKGLKRKAKTSHGSSKAKIKSKLRRSRKKLKKAFGEYKRCMQNA